MVYRFRGAPTASQVTAWEAEAERLARAGGTFVGVQPLEPAAGGAGADAAPAAAVPPVADAGGKVWVAVETTAATPCGTVAALSSSARVVKDRALQVNSGEPLLLALIPPGTEMNFAGAEAAADAGLQSLRGSAPGRDKWLFRDAVEKVKQIALGDFLAP